MLVEVQSRLFDLGADLASPAEGGHRDKISPLSADYVKEIEGWIDEIDGGNEPMRVFVLPGGTELAARLHGARAVCRRAERRIVVLSRTADIGTQAIIYVNRLSDLLFAMSRRANKDAGVADIPWGGKNP